MITKVQKLFLFCIVASLTLVAVYLYTTKYLSLQLWITADLQRTKPKEICNGSIAYSKSEWFRNKSDPSVRPFWTADHLEMDEDVSKFWHGIQISKTIDLKPIFEELFKLGVPKYRNITFDNDDCVTCAVVGNSLNIKDARYGKNIDEHEIVIRFNNAITQGFEEDVGTKTTYQLIYPESARESYNVSTITLCPFKPKDILWLLSAYTDGHIRRTYRNLLPRVSWNTSKVAILHPDLIRYVYTNWMEKKGRYPPTGAIGVGLALQLCHKIDVYGFGPDKRGAWLHYWDDKKHASFARGSSHNWTAQEELLQKLADEKIIQLYRGMRNVSYHGNDDQ